LRNGHLLAVPGLRYPDEEEAVVVAVVFPGCFVVDGAVTLGLFPFIYIILNIIN